MNETPRQDDLDESLDDIKWRDAYEESLAENRRNAREDRDNDNMMWRRDQ